MLSERDNQLHHVPDISDSGQIHSKRQVVPVTFQVAGASNDVDTWCFEYTPAVV